MKSNEGQRETERLAAIYAEMGDAELRNLHAKSADLTDVAQAALRSEIKRRGIEAGAVEETPPASAVRFGDDQTSAWKTLHVFSQTFEAQAAFKLLDREEIEFALEDRTVDESGQLRAGPAVQIALMVHGADRDRAVALLRSEAGLFPEAVLDPRGPDPHKEDGGASEDTVTVGEFDDQADVSAASRVLEQAGLWFRLATHPGEEWERTSIEVRPQDADQALDALESLLDDDAHRP